MRTHWFWSILLAATSVPAAAQSWVAAGTGEGRAARIEQSGSVTGLGFVCNGTRALLSMQLAQPAAANRANVRFLVGQQQAAVSVQRNSALRQPIYVAFADDRLIELIRNAPNGARLVVMVEGGATAVFNLTGAREALGASLAGCTTSHEAAVAKRPDSRPGAVGKSPKPSALAATPGFYIDADPASQLDCGKLTWDALFWYGAESDPTLKVDRGERLDKAFRVLSADRIAYSDGEVSATYRRCDDSLLRPDTRYFDAADVKHPGALPIKPGYYRLRDPGGVIEYFLLDQARIAWMDTVAFDNQGRPSRRQNVVRPMIDIVQLGPRVYGFAYQRWPADSTGDGKTSVPLLIETPERFSGWFQENDVMRYEPVTAQQIPVALRPHF